MTMPDDDRFEQDLARVVRAAAPNAAPVELRKRIAATLEVGPVRPRSRSSSWLLGAAAGVAALLLVALAWPRMAQLPGATSVLGDVSAPATQGATVIDSPIIPYPAASDGYLLTHPGEVQNGQLITPTDGVVMNTNGRVLMTASGGATWRDITPGLGTEQAAERLFFLDPDRGWIVTFDPTAGGGIVVWRTVDGGRSWDETDIPALRSVNWNLEMLSPTVGWLASDPGGEAPKPELRWTHDGGATWSDPIDLAAGTSKQTLDSITFLDEANGVITGDDYVLHTSDGGHSWSAPTVSNTDFEVVSGTPRYGTVRVLSSTTAFMVIDWLDSGGKIRNQTIVETTNGGAFWFARYGDASHRSWDIVDASHWIATDGETVWSTADGGTGWGAGTSTGLPVIIDSARLQFVDPLNGWAVAHDGPLCKGVFCPARFFVLFKTADGGATWAPVGDCGEGTIAACPSPRPS
jgi:photosystem II stability/assembly factor-like uncharacterized protein